MMQYNLIARILFLLTVMLAFQGCAAITHYNYKRDIMSGAGSAVFADAKQRAVITSQNPSGAVNVLLKLRDEAKDQAKFSQAELGKAQDLLAAHKNDAFLAAQYAENANAHRQNAVYYTQFADKVMRKILSGNFATRDLRVIRTCAEPSPDALSALAASGGIAGEIFGKGQGQIQAALAESAGSIGLRTQSIQLMRDAMFRLCEGYMNDALGNAAFETLHRRFQNSMVAILAIEQLTGAVQAQAVALSSGASTGPSEKLAEITNLTVATRSSLRKAEGELEQADAAKKKKAEEIADLKSEKKALDTQIEKDDACIEKNKGKDDDKKEACDPSKLSGEKRGEIEKEIDAKKASIETGEADFAKLATAASDKKTQVDDLKANLEAYDRAAAALRLGKSTAFANAEIYGSDGNKDPECCDQDMDHVATAVHNIVEDFYKQSYIDEVCTTLFTSAADGELDGQSFTEFLKRFEFEARDRKLSPIPGKTTIFEICAIHIGDDAEQKVALAKERVRFAEERLTAVEQKSQKIAGREEKLEERETRVEKSRKAIMAETQRLRGEMKKLDDKELEFLEDRKEIKREVSSDVEVYEGVVQAIADTEALSDLIESVCAGGWGGKKMLSRLVVNENKRAEQCGKLIGAGKTLEQVKKETLVRKQKLESVRDRLEKFIENNQSNSPDTEK